MASKFFIFLIASLFSLAIMGGGIFVPALPLMVETLNSDAKTLTATLSLIALGSWFASPFYGPAADSYGRRFMALIALFLFVSSATLCAAAPTVTILFISCFLLGIACTGLQIIGIAVLGDLYKGLNYTRISAFTGAIITLTVSISPLVGGFMGSSWGWRCIFWLLGFMAFIIFYAVWRYFPETSPSLLEHSLKNNLVIYRRMLTHWGFVIAVLLSALLSSLSIAYTSMTAYFYVNELNLLSSHVGALHALGSLVNALTCFAVIPLTKRWSNFHLVRHGIGWTFASGIMFLALGFLNPNSLSLSTPYILFNIALGFTIAPLTVIAVEYFPNAKGTASAIILAIRSLVASVIAYLAGSIYDGSHVTIALFFSSLMFLIIALYIAAFSNVYAAIRSQLSGYSLPSCLIREARHKAHPDFEKSK